jgi:hypothetical protein
VVEYVLNKKALGSTPNTIKNKKKERNLRQEDHKFKASLGYIVSSRTTWDTQ